MNSEADQLSKRISKKYLFVIIFTVIAMMVAIITTFSILTASGGSGG